MFQKKALISLAVFLVMSFCLVLSVNADIIAQIDLTSDAQISMGNVLLASGTTGGNGEYLDVKDTLTGASITDNMGYFDTLNPEQITLNFNLAMNGNGYQSADIDMYNFNAFEIYYFVSSNTKLAMSYNFAYGGTDALGMNSVLMDDTNVDNTNYLFSSNVGNLGYSGTSFDGTITENLGAGVNEIQTFFNPHVDGPIGDLNGTLYGQITYSFTPVTPVPEPGTGTLFGVGLACLAGIAIFKKTMKGLVSTK